MMYLSSYIWEISFMRHYAQLHAVLSYSMRSRLDDTRMTMLTISLTI